MKNLPGIKPSVPCHQCANDAKARWECRSCGIAICLDCVQWSNRLEVFLEHHLKVDPEGRQFLCINLPYHNTLSKWRIDPCPCMTIQPTAINIHCCRCHAGQPFSFTTDDDCANKCCSVLTLDSIGYWCRNCKVDFGTDVYVCQACFIEDELHRQKHRFGTYTITFENTDVHVKDAQLMLNKMFGCTECPASEYLATFDGVDSLTRPVLGLNEDLKHLHQHLNLKIITNPLFLEICWRQNYRGCVLQRPRFRPKPGSFSCDLCAERESFNALIALKHYLYHGRYH